MSVAGSSLGRCLPEMRGPQKEKLDHHSSENQLIVSGEAGPISVISMDLEYVSAHRTGSQHRSVSPAITTPDHGPGRKLILAGRVSSMETQKVSLLGPGPTVAGGKTYRNLRTHFKTALKGNGR